jgi:RND family efflux transporter MFP subunit
MRDGMLWPWLAMTLVVASGCKRSNAGQGLPPPTGSLAIPAIPVAATNAEVAATAEELTASGTSGPVREAKLGPKASGVIAAMYVEEGDQVKKGQVLFRLDASTVAMGIVQAQAALNTATVGRDSAETELRRTQTLYERGSIAPAVYDQVKARFDGANAAVEQAKAALGTAKKMTADTTVISPIAGVVAARKASVGDTVTMMPPTIVLVVQDISSLEVRARVAETELKRLSPGKPIRIRFPSVDAERVVPIERINPSVDPMTRTVEVVALVPNQDHALKAGMLVEVDFGQPEAGPSSSASATSATPTSSQGKKP